MCFQYVACKPCSYHTCLCNQAHAQTPAAGCSFDPICCQYNRLHSFLCKIILKGLYHACLNPFKVIYIQIYDNILHLGHLIMIFWRAFSYFHSSFSFPEVRGLGYFFFFYWSTSMLTKQVVGAIPSVDWSWCTLSLSCQGKIKSGFYLLTHIYSEPEELLPTTCPISFYGTFRTILKFYFLALMQMRLTTKVDPAKAILTPILTLDKRDFYWVFLLIKSKSETKTQVKKVFFPTESNFQFKQKRLTPIL